MTSYTLGQPMQFEATSAMIPGPGNQRIYIDQCFMTATLDPNATPKHTIIDNHG